MSAAVRVADLSDGRPLSIAGATVLVLLNGTASVYAADGASGNLAAARRLGPPAPGPARLRHGDGRGGADGELPRLARVLLVIIDRTQMFTGFKRSASEMSTNI